MIHQWFAHFERVRHAGTVDLSIDVADEISLQVQILDCRKGIIGLSARGVPAKYFDCAITLQSSFERAAEELAAHRFTQHRHRVEIRFDRIAGQRFKRGLRAKDARSPIELRISSSEK